MRIFNLFLVLLVMCTFIHRSYALDRFGMLTQSSITATITSTKVLDANFSRSYLLIQNVGTDTIIVKLGSVQSGSEGVQIPAGGNWEPSKAPADSIYLESVSGSQAVTLIEGQ